MNSTLFSVRASTPVDIGIRSRATVMWMPLDGRIVVAKRAPDPGPQLVGPRPCGEQHMAGGER